MKRRVILLFSLVALSFAFGQNKNKFSDILNTKKLGYAYKKEVKERDKPDFFQQYYWVSKAEYLRSFKHLSSIKPIVFYEFVSEITPVIPNKGLDDKQKQLRKDSDEALTNFFINRKFDSPLLPQNLDTFVDPTGEKYVAEVDPEKVAELVPKELFTFTTKNKNNTEQKTYYLWIPKGKDDYKFVEAFPGEKDKAFKEKLNKYMPGFEIPKFVPTVEVGDKRDKRTEGYYFITPFQVGSNNIVYKTKDFKDFESVGYKKAGGPWMDVELKDQ